MSAAGGHRRSNWWAFRTPIGGVSRDLLLYRGECLETLLESRGGFLTKFYINQKQVSKGSCIVGIRIYAPKVFTSMNLDLGGGRKKKGVVMG